VQRFGQPEPGDIMACAPRRLTCSSAVTQSLVVTLRFVRQILAVSVPHLRRADCAVAQGGEEGFADKSRNQRRRRLLVVPVHHAAHCRRAQRLRCVTGISFTIRPA